MKKAKIPKNFVCYPCDYSTEHYCKYVRHLSTTKHENVTNGVTNWAKMPNEFVCKVCDYSTVYHSKFVKHLLATNHEDVTLCNQISNATFACICGRLFNNKVSLWRHKKVCEDIIAPAVPPSQQVDITLLNNKITQLENQLQQQSELMLQISNKLGTQVPISIGSDNQINVSNIISNNNNTNCNNKSFNLNFYLNETCKDAINIEDFVSSVKVTLEDLERTGREGYVDGITKIAVKNLNDYGETMRPFHCGDLKREIMYVKSNNEWTKETDSKPILTKAVKAIARENIKQIQKYQQKYPDCTEYNSKKNNLYLKIVSNSMNGYTDEECKQNIDKVIHNLAKETTIDKKAAIHMF